MTYRNLTLAVGLLAGAAGTVFPAAAQETSAVRDDAKTVRLSEFDVNKYKDSVWFADEMHGAKVFGTDNNQVGTVQGIIMDKDGQVEKLVIETGGFLDIGDKVIAVPWKDIDITPDKAGVAAKTLSAENMGSFSLFNDRESVDTGPRSFRAAELQGDYVNLKGGEGYGYVRDLMFDRDGKLQAIVVATDIAYGGARGGYYAYPYHGYGQGFDPGADNYGLPYTGSEIEGYEPFDYPGWGGDRV